MRERAVAAGAVEIGMLDLSRLRMKWRTERDTATQEDQPMITIHPSHNMIAPASFLADAGFGQETCSQCKTCTCHDQGDTLADPCPAATPPENREEQNLAEPRAIVEIDWAEDRAGNSIEGPVGPFDSEHLADEWALEAIYNGEWNTARLKPPTPVILPRKGTDT
jgi:hypothetical protein